MPAGVAEEETVDEKDKGELVYQESKEFHSEQYLCNAYDSQKSKRVTFEIYGLDTQDMYTLGYEYAAFDNLFRFNAELMNPNRKEGRFHWVIERLVIQTFNGKDDHTLKLGPEPSEEVSQLPLYETQRKIPTGRMDLQERSRLREQMDMLDIRRAENISKKRAATKQRVLAHIRALQEEDKLRKQSVNMKIAEERQNRQQYKEDAERKEREEQAKVETLSKHRRKAEEVKEERTEEQDEAEYRELRARWRIRDDEKAKNLEDIMKKREKDLRARKDDEQREQGQRESIQAKRQMAWKAREDRVKRKEDAEIRAIIEVKTERLRVEKLQKERNAEYLSNLHVQRQPIFAEQLEHTEDRRLAREQEEHALLNYKETRALPKKVKTKGKYAPKKTEMTTPKAKAKAKGKKKGGGEDETDAEEQGAKGDTERVLDAVEAKMRREMEEQQRREDLQEKRDEKIGDKDHKWQDRENEHNREIREAYRKSVTAREQAAGERHIIMQQKGIEAAGAEERKKAERARLQKVREQNIARREQQRFEHLCAN